MSIDIEWSFAIPHRHAHVRNDQVHDLHRQYYQRLRAVRDGKYCPEVGFEVGPFQGEAGSSGW